MRLILVFALLPIIAYALPWCSTPECDASFEFRQALNVSNASGLTAFNAPVADVSSFRVVAHGGTQPDVPMNHSFGKIFFSASNESVYYLYYSNSPKSAVNGSFFVNITRVNMSHADAGPSASRDGSVGDSSTYYQHVGGAWGSGTDYFKYNVLGSLVRAKLQMVLSANGYYTYMGFCGKGFNFCSGGGCNSPSFIAMEVCLNCPLKDDPSVCAENGTIRAYTWVHSYLELSVYDVSFEYDYVNVNGTPSLGVIEKAPNVTVSMDRYQSVGVLNYTVVNDGAEPSNLSVVDSGLLKSEPGVYEVLFNVSHDGISKIVSREAIVYSKSERRVLNITSLSSAELNSQTNYSFYSPKVVQVDFPYCGISFALSANSTATKSCDSKQNVSVTDLGLFFTESITASKSYVINEVLLTPQADEVILFSNETFEIKNGSVEVKKYADITYANRELGQKNGTEYAFNKEINVSSAFSAPLQNVSLECEKGAWKAYSTYTLRNGSYEKTNAIETGSSLILPLVSLNESVIISYDPEPVPAPSSGAGGAGSPVVEPDEPIVQNVSAADTTEENAAVDVNVSVFLDGNNAKVLASSLGCWSKLDGGSFEEMMASGGASSFTYLNVAPGNHSVFVKCLSDSANASFEVVENEKPRSNITAMAAAGGNEFAGLAVFCAVACAVTAVFLRKKKNINILSPN